MAEVPHTRQQVVRCPFYGFGWPAATPRLMQVAGNQCGLALDRNEPCAMEEAGMEVDMEMCPTAQRLVHFIRSAGPVITFVVPDHPEGLSYAAWWRRTMAQASTAAREAQSSLGSDPDRNSR